MYVNCFNDYLHARSPVLLTLQALLEIYLLFTMSTSSPDSSCSIKPLPLQMALLTEKAWQRNDLRRMSHTPQGRVSLVSVGPMLPTNHFPSKHVYILMKQFNICQIDKEHSSPQKPQPWWLPPLAKEWLAADGCWRRKLPHPQGRGPW